MTISNEQKVANGLGGDKARKAAEKKDKKQKSLLDTLDSQWLPQGGGYGGAYNTAAPHQVWKCRHYHRQVPLPDGSMVQASSFTTKLTRRQTAPDFALYCDRIWMPVEHWRAEFIAWPDFGAPLNAMVAADAIIEAWERIDRGWLIETGCVGGHGRTGTVLAAWTILAGIHDVDNAMKWVWDHYCTEAIESKAQMAWLDWFIGYADEQFGGAA